MKTLLPLVCLVAVLGLSACDSAPGAFDDASSSLVITEGIAAPAARLAPPALSEALAAADVGGSAANAVSLKPLGCDGSSQDVKVTYTVSGRQSQIASFKVKTNWSFNGTSWTPGTAEETVTVPVRPQGADPTTFRVTLTVANNSAVSSGAGAFTVTPYALATSGQGTLDITDANVTVNVAFSPCAVVNTAPWLNVPTTAFTVEATSSAGATADFAASVTAGDEEDGLLAASCSPASGSVFPLGATSVSCSVTDSGRLTTTAGFDVVVVDTTPAAFTSFPTGTTTLIAANSGGAQLDVDGLGIAVADWNGVSEPSTFECDYTAGSWLAIGSTTTVSCRASDAIGNTSAPSTFSVSVGLNVGGTSFLSPLRMAGPYSAHKLGSTIPHKFNPPTYADGTPATDLASGLSLVVRKLDGSPEATSIDGNDYSAGSTAWRFEDGKYIFNLKTASSSPWSIGTWETTVSYAGIVLGQTRFDMRR